MQIQKLYTPFKKCIRIFTRSKSGDLPVKSIETVNNGADVLAMQNRILVRAVNQVEPLQVKFKSTKDMYNYAKARCVSALNSESPYEHSVVMDTKKNIVIAEYKGDAKCCKLDNLETYTQNNPNIVIMHGHPNNFPLSSADISLLKKYNVSKVIAVNKDGEFSLAGHLSKLPDSVSEQIADRQYHDQVLALLDDFYNHTNSEFYRQCIHDNLKTHAKDMGIRYITNYSYIKALESKSVLKGVKS